MNKKPVTPKSMKQLAMDIIRYLHKHSMFYEVNIYVANQHYASNPINKSDFILEKMGDIDIYHDKKEIDVTKQVEFSNPDTITITFEGPMYHDINYGKECSLIAINQKAEKYGLYAERGYAWSLSLYS